MTEVTVICMVQRYEMLDYWQRGHTHIIIKGQIDIRFYHHDKIVTTLCL